ncbi:MAG: hypothetical protein ISS77_06380 [Phycisphaerae bacterium]|nr:hypothetical protein [Phycisphaerae bacterium]
MYKELKNHAPFTSLGALTGLILMFFFKNIEPQTSETLFYIFHPAHVVLSALVTAAMFSLYMKKAKFITVLLVGYVGAIGIATLSDSIIPFLGEKLIGFHPHAHIGFIEKWYIVNPAAILGVIIAYFLPKTKFPHAAHVLLSTWASAFHMLIALNGNFTTPKAIMCFAFLFLAVWLPCCISDIIFPLLFVNSNSRIEHHH